jgi:O-antigen/teichoic acid export membrane protein
MPVDLRAYRDVGAVKRAASPRALWSKVMGMWRQHKDLLANTVSLLGTTLVTSALGFSFWTVAAREFSQTSVGYGSAAVSALSLLSTIGIFGLGTVLIGELPRRNPRAGLVSASLLACGILSLILGIAFAVIAGHASKQFEVIFGKPTSVLVFGIGVALGAVALVFDAATIGLLRGGVQLTRNLVFAAAKMVALPLAALVIHDQFGTGIFLSWISGIAISLAASAIWLRMHGSPVFPAPDWGVLRGLGKTALAHNWLNLAIAVPVTLIPVLVTVVVSAKANAAFYIAWMLMSFLYSVPVALSTVLFAVAAANPRIIAQKLRFALKLSLLIGVPAMLILIVGAHLALSLFGVAYAKEATFSLWFLSASYVPGLPKNFYIAVCRAEGNISRAAVVLTAFAVLEIVAAGVSGHFWGLNGLSMAIFFVTLIEGIATTPAVLRAIRRDDKPQRVRKATPSLAGSMETTANTALDYPTQINANGREQQAEGIAALEWLARYQQQAAKFD